jgi:hypothetical protein
MNFWKVWKNKKVPVFGAWHQKPAQLTSYLVRNDRDRADHAAGIVQQAKVIAFPITVYGFQ